MAHSRSCYTPTKDRSLAAMDGNGALLSFYRLTLPLARGTVGPMNRYIR
jgi:hypothetical protein